MKATFTINQLQFELAADEARHLFQQVAQIQEIFEAETQCGCCQSESLRYGYREVDSYKFYELCCRDCGAQFKFGQKKQTNELFPKRKDDAGNVLPNRGWSKWEPRDGDDHAPAKRQQQQQPARPPASTTARPATIPNFPDWEAAERSEEFARAKPLRVAGELFHIPSGKREYVSAPPHAQ